MPIFSLSGATHVEDTYLDQESDVGHGTSTLRILRPSSGSYARQSTLIRLRSASIPAGIIVSATLRLIHDINNSPGFTSWTEHWHRVKAANAAWTEAGARWSSLDGVTAWTGGAGCGGTVVGATSDNAAFFSLNEEPSTPVVSGGTFGGGTARTATIPASWLTAWRDAPSSNAGIIIRSATVNWGDFYVETERATGQPLWTITTLASPLPDPLFDRRRRS